MAALVAVGAAAVLGLFVLWLLASAAFAQPRSDRDWVEHLARMPEVQLRDDGFAMQPVTDWAYAPEGPTDKAYTAAAFDFADLRNVWFVIEPHPGMRPMAHTLVLFEFSGDRLVGLTVEARREADEKYSAFWGAFNRFELAYIWSTARDLLVRRAVMLDHDVLVYPLALSEEQKQNFLMGLINKTIAVSEKPRFYNTLVSNCTNELAKTARLDWHYAFVMTGYSAERLFELGLIPGEDMEAERAKAQFKSAVAGWSSLSAPDFDRALLAELRSRFGAPHATPQTALQ